MFETNTYIDPNTITHYHHDQTFTDQTLENHLMMNMEMNNNPHDQTPPDLLNLFQLPRCSSFSDPNQIDHLLPPFFRDCGSVFGEMEMERPFYETDGIIHANNKNAKHFATEKHRRQQLNGKFDALKSLVPHPSKSDRASVVGDAINYINELKRSVEELKILVDRKRCNKGRMKKHKTTQDESTLDVDTRSNGGHDQQAYNNGNTTSTMRSSWLQRKSKHTEIDVRILDDEVTIKLVQQKRINCLLLVSKVVDELQLDLHHVAGGLVGDFYSYLFNTKICEGSSVYASAIANKLIQVVDKQYASISVTSSY